MLAYQITVCRYSEAHIDFIVGYFMIRGAKVAIDLVNIVGLVRCR